MIDSTAMTAHIPINAGDYFDQRAEVTVSANRLAIAVLQRVQPDVQVLISFVELRGVASTYFNTLFADLLAALGRERFRDLIVYKYGTSVQQQAAERSLQAVLDDAA